MSKKQLRETAILNAACSVIKHKGFHQARMADIAKEAGVSYGLAYHYFKNKEDIFDAIIDSWWKKLFELIDTLEKDSNKIEEKLDKVIGYFLDQFEENPDLLHVFIAEISRSTSNLTAPRLEYFKNFIDKIESVIINACKSGELRGDIKARYLTYLFLGGLEAVISSMVLENQNIKNEAQKKRIRKSLIEAFLNGAKTR